MPLQSPVQSAEHDVLQTSLHMPVHVLEHLPLQPSWQFVLHVVTHSVSHVSWQPLLQLSPQDEPQAFEQPPAHVFIHLALQARLHIPVHVE